MKICITAKSPSPLSAMDNDFKNCAYFSFFVDGSMGFEATINNKENDPEQLLIDKEANILITKNISSQSLTMLNKANIEVFTASSKLITDALSRFRNGELKPLRKIDINSNLQRKENHSMKVAISTDGNYVSAHFGRCPSFTIADIQDSKVVTKEVVDNPGHHPGYLPKFLHEKGAEYIVAGGMGQRAQILFNENNIKTVMGISGNIDEVLNQICNGTLKGGESLCKPGAGKGYGLDKTECDHDEHDH